MTTPPKKRNKPKAGTPARKAYDGLHARIEAGEWAPGQDIGSGTKLAEHYGCTYPQMIHAIQALRDEGRLKTGKGGIPTTVVGSVATDLGASVQAMGSALDSITTQLTTLAALQDETLKLLQQMQIKGD